MVIEQQGIPPPVEHSPSLACVCVCVCVCVCIVVVVCCIRMQRVYVWTQIWVWSIRLPVCVWVGPYFWLGWTSVCGSALMWRISPPVLMCVCVHLWMCVCSALHACLVASCHAFTSGGWVQRTANTEANGPACECWSKWCWYQADSRHGHIPTLAYHPTRLILGGWQPREALSQGLKRPTQTGPLYCQCGSDGQM